FLIPSRRSGDPRIRLPVPATVAPLDARGDAAGVRPIEHPYLVSKPLQRCDVSSVEAVALEPERLRKVLRVEPRRLHQCGYGEAVVEPVGDRLKRGRDDERSAAGAGDEQR